MKTRPGKLRDLHNVRRVVVVDGASPVCFRTYVTALVYKAPFRSSPATIFTQKTNQPTYQNADHLGYTFIRGLRLSITSWYLLQIMEAH